MPGRIRVLDASNKTMQRLGYLKALCALVNETETSTLAALGSRLIERVTKRIRLAPPFEEAVKNYAKTRLGDRAYTDIRRAILGDAAPVGLELQDLYLASPSLPSNTGKLVQTNWRRYPYLGTSLELIKKGTYSALTRSSVLLAVIPKAELAAFSDYDPGANPLCISDAQACVLLYCLIDNDAEILHPLLTHVVAQGPAAFDERVAGDALPDILKQIIKAHNRRALTPEERDRLALLAKSAASIERRKGADYSGGSAREETVRVRMEPYCDLGFLTKPAKDKFNYQITDALRVLLDRWVDLSETDKLLHERFFSACAACRGIAAHEADDNEATEALFRAGGALKSNLGYSPITDVWLLAGTQSLTEKKLILEQTRTVELLKRLQKQDPPLVRFTVDRMGALAFVKFLKPTPGG